MSPARPSDAATGTATTLADITAELSNQDTAARVRAAVETLPLEQREAVVLAYFGGLTFREVAATLGLPEGTAKSRLRLALGKLSNVLAADGVTSWT